MPASKTPVLYVVRSVPDRWFYVSHAQSMLGPTVTFDLELAKQTVISGAKVIVNSLRDNAFPVGEVEIVAVTELANEVPDPEPAPVQKSKYMDDATLMLALSLILAMHKGNRARIQAEIQDLYKRVPYERRAQLRRIVKHRFTESVLEKLLQMHINEGNT